ncbi:MAG: bifunctional 4-hydroxy-2-oxoglutarate aldolase/2-dehydro-3-deoxy-phosphogluconate aldolase [Streptococcaceae bacterium]|nr:bifunctional 4-hydroxy-2-oxoglutarate aldolase/2-dehydro-3-deoxy-phosphogluconate aldolase [Streptococcaceae bacterium]MCH4176909.1 bifunctional 4-hydroxy-2-oxoglutarate aldolase/2-dehydro-3-deoxy-phosphogluconate aldolase [Streptococcaceae bacterium]
MFDIKEHPVYQEVIKSKLLPLYTATDLTYLSTVEKVLVQNEVRLIEVTFRSDLAGKAIRVLSESGNLIVGAGTVKTKEQVISAVENGAEFIVSPSVIPEVVDYCLEENIPVFPGVATPNDIQRAMELGLNVLKFFPADIYGGLKAIEAISGPYFEIEFIPTGGIDADNFTEYLANDKIIAVGGSFILSEKNIMKDNGLEANRVLKELLNKK